MSKRNVDLTMAANYDPNFLGHYTEYMGEDVGPKVRPMYSTGNRSKWHDLFHELQLNDGQKNLREAIFDENNQVIIVNAVAGSGKTLMAVACAKQLVSNYPKQFVGAHYVFPTAEEMTLGYRPGTTAEKERDYLRPLYQALVTIGEQPEKAIQMPEDDKPNPGSWITAESATFMRGMNIKNEVLIIDECQNLTVPVIKRIVSRAHDNCKVIVLGCTEQMDIPKSMSGFTRFMDHMSQYPRTVKIDLPISYRGELAMWIDKM